MECGVTETKKSNRRFRGSVANASITITHLKEVKENYKGLQLEKIFADVPIKLLHCRNLARCENFVG